MDTKVVTADIEGIVTGCGFACSAFTIALKHPHHGYWHAYMDENTVGFSEFKEAHERMRTSPLQTKVWIACGAKSDRNNYEALHARVVAIPK